VQRPHRNGKVMGGGTQVLVCKQRALLAPRLGVIKVDHSPHLGHKRHHKSDDPSVLIN
jgi:hypothetical protein